MKWYPWLSEHLKKFIKIYRGGFWHHALLIHSAPGMGKDKLIAAMAKFLVCQHPGEYKSCSKCSSCQLMRAHSNPDYYILEPETKKDMIGIEVVRETTEKINKYAHSGGNKVVWIKNATKLTTAATNALLKTLEEPLEKTWFFLSCDDPAKLLATLRSRCRIYYLNTPDETWAINWIANKVESFPESVLSALRLSGGSPAAAIMLLQSEIWSQREQLCRKLSLALKTGDWLSLFEILNHEQVSQRLCWLGSILLDAMKLQVGTTLISNTDAYSLINILANRVSRDIAQTILHDI